MQNGSFFSKRIIKGAIIGAIVILLSAAIFILAYDQKKEADCHDTAFTTVDMDECALHDKQEAEAAMESVYQQLLAKIGPEHRLMLKEARKAWEAYRKRQCKFDTLGTEGGTIHTMIHLQCLGAMTRDYQKILEYQLNCVEGDLSCGGQ